LRTEIIRRQDFAGGIGGDLTGTEDELIRSLGGYDVRIIYCVLPCVFGE
jgi:hypothetical protein